MVLVVLVALVVLVVLVALQVPAPSKPMTLQRHTPSNMREGAEGVALQVGGADNWQHELRSVVVVVVVIWQYRDGLAAPKWQRQSRNHHTNRAGGCHGHTRLSQQLLCARLVHRSADTVAEHHGQVRARDEVAAVAGCRQGRGSAERRQRERDDEC